MVLSLGRIMWTKTIFSEKAASHFKKKTNFSVFFTNYRVWQATGNFLLDSKMIFCSFCASQKIISVTPKVLLETIFLQREAIFLWENKKLGQPLFVSSTLTNLKKQFPGVHKVLWVLVRNMQDYFNGTYEPKRLIQLPYSRKKISFEEKKFLPQVFSFAEYGRTQIKLYMAPCILLATVMHIIGSFQEDLNFGYRLIFQNQSCIPDELKSFDLLLSTSMTDLK